VVEGLLCFPKAKRSPPLKDGGGEESKPASGKSASFLAKSLRATPHSSTYRPIDRVHGEIDRKDPSVRSRSIERTLRKDPFDRSRGEISKGPPQVAPPNRFFKDHPSNDLLALSRRRKGTPSIDRSKVPFRSIEKFLSIDRSMRSFRSRRRGPFFGGSESSFGSIDRSIDGDDR